MINELTVSLKLRIIIFRAEEKIMYHQVRFAQGTCLSFLKSSEVFHLM